MIQELEQSKEWLERMISTGRSISKTVGAYDLEKSQELEDDVAMFQALLKLVEARGTLKIWLKHEILATRVAEQLHVDARRYAHASQQADFRAALHRVETEILLRERIDEGS